MKDHPTKDIIETLSSKLRGKTIVLCITGSVGAVKSSELARLLIRHGAKVIPVMSEAATKLIHPDMIHWATGIKPITELTGEVEHVKYAGNTTTKADLILFYPATANTIGKIANGIDDTVITTFATTAIGEGIKMKIVPAMHYPMYNHPFVKENIAKLKSIDIDVFDPVIEEGKAKIPSPEYVCEDIINFFHKKKILKNSKILITAGRTVEYIDPIRVITNNSSGKMGKAIAEEAINLGAEVDVIYGLGTVEMPAGANTLKVETAEQMLKASQNLLKENSYDYIFCVAAVGDWMPVSESKTKISTHTAEEITLTLKPTPKILDNIGQNKNNAKLIAFRAEHNLADEELITDATKRMQKANADYIAANDTSKENTGFMTDTNRMIFISRDGKMHKTELDTKKNIALELIQFTIEN